MPKPKRCQACKSVIENPRPFQKACGPLCAIALVHRAKKADEVKKARREKREYYENDKATWEKRARLACHSYIRMRDAGKPCVSCGTTDDVQYAAGHYRPSGINSALRYDERNIHLQCNRYCNLAMSGNLTKYRIGLIERIGEAAVTELDANHEVKRWTIDELRAVCTYYKAKIKELESSKD